ncbi:MAG: MotA/TolQ/ExbB proton channel family protein [Gammaproteobacteria bacterium]|nr:MotA/TolQ/ExbB proton channel family protein [Gammaproteobacteria bacterium]
MLELFRAGGLLMWPILFCSILATAIVIERFWSLRRRRIAPRTLVAQVWHWEKDGHIDAQRIHDLRRGSPLGRVLAAGLSNRRQQREIMKERIEEVGRHVSHDLGRFLNTLGTIASITPLLGLLGTVIGMIKVFAVITAQGVGNPVVLAEGISEALLTTAAGLSVAIPTLMFYRYFRGKVEELVVAMEQEAMRLVEVIYVHGRAAGREATEPPQRTAAGSAPAYQPLARKSKQAR